MLKKTRFIFLLSIFIANSVNAKPLILILDWLINPNHAAIFIAQKKGFFAQQGVKVNIIVPSDPDDGPKLVAMGRADLAVTYEPQLILQIVQNLPLVRIATLIDNPLNCILVRKEDKINNIADLRGKRIGYTSHVEGTLALEANLKKAGLTLDDVKLFNIQYNITQAFLSKRLDAITNVMRNVEPLQFASFGQPVKIFPIEKAMPPYDELLIVTNHNKIKDIRIKKFLIALRQASNFLQKNPAQSWHLFIAKNPTLSNNLTHKIWKATLPYLAIDPIDFNKKKYQNFQNFLYEKKIISKKIPIENFTVKIL